MNLAALTALITAIAALVTAVGTLISHLQLRGQLQRQGTAVKPPSTVGKP